MTDEVTEAQGRDMLGPVTQLQGWSWGFLPHPPHILTNVTGTEKRPWPDYYSHNHQLRPLSSDPAELCGWSSLL